MAAPQQPNQGPPAGNGDLIAQALPPMIPAFSREFVLRLRELWDSPAFALGFVTFCQSCQFPDVHTRLRLEEIGGLQLAMDVIRDDSDNALTGRAWVVLQNFVLVNRVDDPLEMKPIDVFVARGGVELACIELNRDEPRWAQTILTALAWTSTNEKAVPRVVASGAHKIGIRYIRDQHPQYLDISMSFIRSTSVAAACRSTLRADGALEAFLPFIECNNSNEPFQMRRGFRAASVVARLAGNDETGIGPQTLRNNPSLISTTLRIFSQVLDAGPHGTVINMLVNPHFITMDLLIISTADVNKPLLLAAIPICMAALRLRGESNGPMVADIVKMFLQLSYEPNCRKELLRVKQELCDLLKSLVPPPHRRVVEDSTSPGFVHDKETYMAAQHLIQTLQNPSPAVSSSSTSASVSTPAAGLGGFVRRIVGSYGSSSLSDGQPAMQMTELIFQSPSQHVMLSYFWSSAEQVKKLDEMLRAAQVNVWVDFRNVGTNLGDSTEDAINRASLVVVLVTAKFKQSATCRKEVEAAEARGVPILFVQLEQNYKPDGWLGMSMGMGQVVEGWSLQLLRDNCVPRILERAGNAIAVSSPDGQDRRTDLPAEFGSKTPSTADLAHAYSALSAIVNEMRRELAALRTEVKVLRENQQQSQLKQQPH